MSRRISSPKKEKATLGVGSIPSYDIVEEEILETLSDDGGTGAEQRRDSFFALRNSQGKGGLGIEEILVEEEVVDDDEYIEVEVVDSLPLSRSGSRVSAGDEYDEYYDEVELVDSKSNLSIDSNTEVEVITDDDDEFLLSQPASPRSSRRAPPKSPTSASRAIRSVSNDDTDDDADETLFEEILEDEDDLLLVDDEEVYEEEVIGALYRNGGAGGDDTEVEEVTLREDDLLYDGNLFTKSCQVSGSSKNNLHSSDNNPEDEQREDDEEEEDESEEEEDDGVSAEELTEAIEYVLRQERAVAKFILTEEQAEKMAHLPIKVMKIIVDHLESCDNDGTPIDWDFMLKIVLPFCESSGEDDDAASAGPTPLCIEIREST